MLRFLLVLFVIVAGFKVSEAGEGPLHMEHREVCKSGFSKAVQIINSTDQKHALVPSIESRHIQARESFWAHLKEQRRFWGEADRCKRLLACVIKVGIGEDFFGVNRNGMRDTNVLSWSFTVVDDLNVYDPIPVQSFGEIASGVLNKDIRPELALGCFGGQPITHVRVNDRCDQQRQPHATNYGLPLSQPKKAQGGLSHGLLGGQVVTLTLLGCLAAVIAGCFLVLALECRRLWLRTSSAAVSAGMLFLCWFLWDWGILGYPGAFFDWSRAFGGIWWRTIVGS